jgi:protoheme IX farnesyltransferase
MYYEDEEEVEGDKAKLQNAASTRAPSTRTSTLSTV